MSLPAESAGFPPEELALGATEVLRDNDMGGWTRASEDLYPHQWSWDTGFIAIGLAHVSVVRASCELLGLFESQWADGKVPHIVFNPDAPPNSYFPGPEHWASAGVFPGAPSAPPYTSALCQPPIHAIAARRIAEIASGGGEEDVAWEFLRVIYPKLLRWHRYLATHRDPESSGLVTIYHPWESGTDNSPRWDEALASVEVGEMSDYERLDLQHVDDPTQRPTGPEYDRYIWLVESIKDQRCDENSLYQTHPFLVKDVLASAILVTANESLAEIGVMVEAPASELEEIRSWMHQGRKGLDGCYDPETGLYLDFDIRAGKPLRTSTVAGFAPLISGGLPPERVKSLTDILFSGMFAGHPQLRWTLPPSTSPLEPGFRPRSYWRGPVWPVMNWLLWWSLRREGKMELAAELRRGALDQISLYGFAEYFEPFTSEPLGSLRQSWTAAVALDWLAAESSKGA